MGIPKFFRWLSERYPLTSQLIDTSTPGSVPEFDHLYLDFNSIIHQCSHPEGVVGPIPTHEIYLSIFAYVEHLFGTIRPKKVFFLAVDGVAPRAKMNQQRGRRFRTALEARETFEKEQRKGGVSEEEWERDRFDSNCITPGTEFMAGLDEQLRYFVHKKITEDAAWRDVEVVLSGHDVPGEGEHKIMAYIRGMSDEERRGVRHCLYGLDADLIMLGLVCHDRHFCLLREEVKFGGRKTGGKQAVTSPGKTPFYLLHIGLLREYLELEFGSVKLDLERLINDLVLLCMFVGNDFLPHLPDLHIHDQALERIFDGYKAVVGDGEDPYLTDETGTIRLPRLQAVFAKLGEWEREVWERERGDVGWLNGKRDVIPVKQGGLTVTPAQRVLFEKIHDFVLSADRHISLVNDFAAGDRKFLGELTADLGLVAEWDAWEGEVNHLVIRKPARTRGVPGAAVEPIAAAVIDEDADEPPESESESESESEEEGQEAIERVLRKYARAAVQPEGTFEEREEGRVNAAMAEWRREYYRDKLGFRDPSEVRDLVKGYVQGLQWVMYYYYRGVPSWGWFYTWHYAPRVGDLTDIASLELTFDLGEPFKPFEQLMGVLPVASGTLVPTCFRELMSSPTSSIRHFYPAEFEQDMNGKKAEWEAVVKIPFIDVNVMRAAMHHVEHMLTGEERKRNSRGTSRVFAVGEGGFYASPLPGFFPALAKDGCVEKEWAPRAGSGWGFGEDSKPKRRTIDNTVMRAGFPSLKTLKHSAVLGVHGVNVHGTESRNRSIVVFIKDEPAGDLKTTLGGRVWVNWPFLREGKVVGVSDEGGRWDHTQLIAGGPSKVLRTPHNPVAWRARGERIEEVYSKKRGVVIGDVAGMLHVRLVVGMERVPETGGLVKRFAVGEVDVPGQMVVRTCPSEEDSRFVERAAVDVKEELGGKRVFFMGEHGYGGVGRVEGVDEERNEVSVVLAFGEPEPDVRVEEQGEGGRWYPSWEAAQRVGVSGRVLGRVTSAFMVVAGRDKVNVGLSFKFEARGIRVVGYSRKAANGWEFSEDAVQACRRYKDTYPVVFDVAGRAAGDMPKAEEMGGPEAVRAIKKWLKEEIGVGSLEEVPLGVERMSKEGVKKLEAMGSKGAGKVKRAMVKGIPRAAVLLPGHGRERLRGQRFGLGDRVVSVEEAAGGGLGARGIVVGIGAPETPGVGVGVGRSAASSVSVLFDAPFMAGTTLGGLCSPYRGAVMDPEGVLNLTERQFVVSVGRPKQPTQPPQQVPPQVSIMPRGGARGRGNGFDDRGRGRGIGSGSGFVERGRGNGFVERGRGSGFVEHARGNGFVERGRGRGNGFIDRGRGGRGRAFAPRGFMQRGGGVSSPPASASS